MQLNSATISFYFAHAIVGEALGGGAIHATPGLVGNLPIFIQRALDQVTPENVDQVIRKVCGLSDSECQMIIRWHAILEGSKHV